jgi:hypothetical protein
MVQNPANLKHGIMKRAYSKEKIKGIIESLSSLKEAEGKLKITHSGLQYYLKKFNLTNHRHTPGSEQVRLYKECPSLYKANA